MKFARRFVLATLVWLALASSAWAAFVQVANSGNSHWNGTGFATTSLTFGAAVTSGGFVFYHVTWDPSAGAGPLTNVTDDKGNVYNPGPDYTIVADGQHHQLFWLGNITNAPTVVTANCSGVGCKFIYSEASEYSQVLAIANPLDVIEGQTQIAPGTGTDAVASSASGTATTFARDQIIGAYIEDTAADASFTAGTGYTKRDTGLDAGSKVVIGIEDKSLTATAATKATLTVPTGTGHYSTAMAAFKLGVGTPATLGLTNSTASATGVITTATNDCPVGSTIILAAAYTTIADTLSGVADSGGNAWQTPVDNTTATTVGIGFAYALNTAHDLPIGGTITATFGGATNSQVRAICVQGLALAAALDAHNHTATGTAASATSVATGTLSQANEFVLGMLGTAATAAGYTPGVGYSNYSTGNTNAPSITMSFKTVFATTSATYAPGWTTSTNYVSNIVSFKAFIPANTNVGALALMGVGR